MGSKSPGTRFVLDTTQLGAALALAGVTPGPRSALPDAPPPADPIRLLEKNSILSNAGQQLSDDAAKTLRLAADPAGMLSCTVNAAGDATWTEVLLLHGGAPDGPFVALQTQDGKYDLTLLPRTVEAISLVESVLGLPDFSRHPDTPSVTLNLVAYAAFLATADAQQTTWLRTRLARTPPAIPVLTPDLLETRLNEGFTHADTRWSVTAGQRICPFDLKATGGRMAAGLAALDTADLVGPVPRGYGFTPKGHAIITPFVELVKTAGFNANLWHGPQRVTIAHVGLFCCARSIWATKAENISADSASFRLLQMTRSEALDLIRSLVGPGDPETAARLAKRKLGPSRLCPSCHQPVKPGARFCTSCRVKLPPKKDFCPNCGEQVTDHGLKFCTNCGHRLGAPAPIPHAVGERRCPKPQCGQIVPAGKNFCTFCGTRMPSEE
ncbi:MAG: zinc ribbon domain-containing protein [Acidobacteria bacterium]|nr:MAG: zinc ribbon domain-containing protein [Acidobacteriota bacterium]